MSADFDLKAVVADAIALAGSPDPVIVSKLALDAIDPADAHAALAIVLPLYVRNAMRNAAVATRPHAEPGKVDERTCRKARAYLARYSVALSTDERDRKWLGDCTYDDLLTAAGIRRNKAAETIAEAEKFERLAEKMRVNRASVVSELSDEAIAEAFR